MDLVNSHSMRDMMYGLEDGSVSTSNTMIKESYVFGRVGLFVCSSVCPQDYLKSNERICLILILRET